MRTSPPRIYLSFLIFLLLTVSASFAQSIPAFKILETNGRTVSTTNLPKSKPVILIYFSPDCPHCTALLHEVFSKFDKFKKATILLVSFRPLTEIAAFEKEYHLSQYKNVIVGMEQPIFYLQKLYQLQSTPFTALFNSNGKLISSYRKDTPVNDLLLHLKNTM